MVVLAADAAAQRILSKDVNHMPAASKNNDADPDASSTNRNTTSATPNPVKQHHLQPSPSPSRLIELQPFLSQFLSSSHAIEPTETLSAPIMSCTCASCIYLTSPNLYCKRLAIDSNATLVPYDDDLLTYVFSDDSSDTDDCESFDDPLDILIAQTNALTLDDPPRTSKFRPLIVVTKRNTTPTIIYPPLPELAYHMDELTRNMQSLSL
ncbi:hypothetical protein DEU56DRAFT_978953 [Suillus clintonianus]|uniref:uncharacterized protein n=1 Tax=Suillus clintonianus TaxID=1904413 RepID=UPI001B87C4EC|nr:uncharacterized protein DEU56DRAFT_978953 [Suillus clintonianus]KAG2145102.1 hypothetical protein DEU56DRAFT_978953 [Suillus clintonianus]